MVLMLGLVCSLQPGGGAKILSTWTRMRLSENHHYGGKYHMLLPISTAWKIVQLSVNSKVFFSSYFPSLTPQLYYYCLVAPLPPAPVFSRTKWDTSGARSRAGR